MRLGETPLNLNREQCFLDFAMKRTVRREEQVARQLHGESGTTLHLASGLDVTVSSAGNAPYVDSPMAVELLVFDRDQRIAQDRRKIFVRCNDPSLQGERADDLSLVVVEFSD